MNTLLEYGGKVEMTTNLPNRITGTISIDVQSQDNGRYRCQLSSSLSDSADEAIQSQGQNQAHAIAIALETLTARYRQRAEEQQNIPWDPIERSDSEDDPTQPYHVTVHYEHIIEAESKFYAMHDTLIGKTIVENAKLTIIQIDPDVPVDG